MHRMEASGGNPSAERPLKSGGCDHCNVRAITEAPAEEANQVIDRLALLRRLAWPRECRSERERERERESVTNRMWGAAGVVPDLILSALAHLFSRSMSANNPAGKYSHSRQLKSITSH